MALIVQERCGSSITDAEKITSSSQCRDSRRKG
jgi:hypothetical protein